MVKLYKKDQTLFSIIWILIYIFSISLSDALSAKIGIYKLMTALISILLVLFLYLFLRKNNILKKHGVCLIDGDIRKYLYFIPLVLIVLVNVYRGMVFVYSTLETLLFVISMLCIGIIEEIIFRGFLFTSMIKDNNNVAILVSSLSFGFGHIVNLLKGAEVFSTLLQMIYASILGLLFTIIFLKSKSILPCMFTHSMLNIFSIFHKQGNINQSIIDAGILCLIAVVYTIWIIKSNKNITNRLD